MDFIMENSVDRPIDPQVRRNTIKRRVYVSMTVSVIILLIMNWGFNHLRPSVSRERVRIAAVERGPVSETISASGTIVPETEYVISSPVSTTVQDILCVPGDILVSGDSLLIFDLSSQRLALEKIGEQISLLENQREQINVDLAMRLNDLESQKRQRELRYAMTETQYHQLEKMFEMGGISQKERDEAELSLEIARIELEQIERSIENESVLAQNQLERLALERSINEKEREELVNTIERARTIIEHGGVLTWITEDVGAQVGTGEVIARIADLDSYCVQATISEIHATKLTPGQSVIVRLGDGTRLEGIVKNIQPAVAGGTISFTVSLTVSNDGHLRSNMRVQLDLVTTYKPDVLRIENGPFTQGYGISDVFVVNGNHAIRREVTFGIAGFDWLEVTDGLAEGDEVIISDISDRLYAHKIRLK